MRDWKAEFDGLWEEDQATVKRCAKQFGVPLMAAYYRAKELGLLKPDAFQPDPAPEQNARGATASDLMFWGYQKRVAAAHHALFHDDPTDVAERVARFFEEAVETCQAFGLDFADAHHLVNYTYDRPVGEPAKEIGAALLTLTSLCVVAGFDLTACGEADLEKLQRPETIARIRAKRSTRHGRGPLPGIDPTAMATEGE